MRSIPAGAAIKNSNGIYGTLGCLALTQDDSQLVFLSSYHVLFGAGAREQSPVWLAIRDTNNPVKPIARTRNGRLGTVTYGGMDVFIDCASAELDPALIHENLFPIRENHRQKLTSGDRVSKIGAGTGLTEGVVVDTDYTDTVRIARHRRTATGQILVRPDNPGKDFSANGDSGAVLHNADGDIVGLLWGVDVRGLGLACPIAPVLQVLHLHLVNFPQEETS